MLFQISERHQQHLIHIILLPEVRMIQLNLKDHWTKNLKFWVLAQLCPLCIIHVTLDVTLSLGLHVCLKDTVVTALLISRGC